MEKIYDVLIVGGGPAGYTAALYAATAGLSALVLEGAFPGGQMAYTPEIWNYPGFPEGIAGVTLAESMKKAAERFGGESVHCRVEKLGLTDPIKTAAAGDRIFYGKTVILATGGEHRHLDVSGEYRLAGKGVSYCATCDGVLYRDREVAVIGGGNSAVSDALLLSRIAKKVTLIHRRDTLRADQKWVERLQKSRNVEMRLGDTVEEFLGQERLSGIVLKSGGEIPAEGAFISVGRAPSTDLVKGLLALDDEGYVLAGEDTVTTIPGVYAAGDVRKKPLRQIVTATADGASAIQQVKNYVNQKS